VNLSLWIARDYVRRVGRDYVLAIAALAVLWLFFAVGSASWSLALALSLAAAAGLGPTIVFGSMARRELLLMPVSRREFWQARWLLSTVVPLAVVLVAQGLGVLAAMPLLGYLPPVLPDPTLTAVCVLLYMGAMLGLAPAQAWWSSPRRRLFSRLVNGLVATTAMVAFLGGMFWPVLLRSHLPAAWSDVRGWVALVFVVATLMTILGYRRVPGAVPHNLPRVVQASASLPSLDRFGMSNSRLSGVPRALWLQLVHTFAFCVGVLGISAGIGAVVGLFEGSSSAWALALDMAGVDWFAGDPKVIGRVFILAFLALETMDTGLLSVPRFDYLRSLVRHLRALPIPVSGVIIALLLRRGIGYISVWLISLGLYVVSTGRPPTLGLSWLAALWGIDALMHGWKLYWGRSHWEALIGGFMLSFLLTVTLRSASPAGVWPLLIAAFFLLLAFAVLKSAITTRRETYQPVDFSAPPWTPAGFR